ncbi:toxin of the YoeB-YefM toxin-antitoxin system [Flavobacterium psychrophilum]|uniref:Txe/YoeB family addiction module toxin n=1 Tax=Flavobacterium psychrophilum TaxID=96345 RepID=UPI000B7C0914|nr:Txe/YoeB family addiction module toxin [Flavobacterium psychrophilum]SNB44361.1 toxin of the YoeB-YefM toxin-antitoxin system [Flavobacterium psychrophilum]
MEIGYTDEALKDISYWKKSGDKIIQNKIQKLIISIQENPTEGIGKPEKLKHNLSGYWSRRINQEHRIIYEIKENNTVEIQSLKGHY